MAALQWVLEVAILVVAAVAFVRRAGVARAPFDAPLAIVVAALVGQWLLAWVFDPGASATAWVIEGLRALLMLAAIAAWISIVRSSPGTRRRLVVLIAGGALLTFGNAGFRTIGLVIVAAAAMLEWPTRLHGWRRGVGLAVALPIAALTAIDPTAVGDTGSLAIGVEVEGVVQAHDLSGPFAQAIDVGLALLRVQLVVAFFRFLYLPVGLRSLPLARRFNVNYILTRSIPWFLSTVTLIAVVILGYGLHKAAEARKEMEGSLARATTAAALLLDDVPFDAAVTQARLALAEDAPGSALILRRGETKTTASAPESLIAHPAFEDDRLLTAAGLLIVEGRLYLVAREREAGASAIPGSAEVWIPIDPTYLGRFSERALVDVELRAMPSVRLGSVVVSFTDEKGMEAAVTVRSPDVAPSFGRGLFIRKFPISRLFLPIGNWRETEEGSPRGAVGMTLRGSLYQAIMAFQRNPYLMTSNVVPLLILGALGILTAIVEGISLRTGRSIVKTVLDDVQALESGAKLIGSGDLDHRIPVPGKDELSKLAGALNTMAADLKQQREELVDKERLEADLEVARSIQQRLLPQGSPIVAGADVAGVSIPSRVVGGDLFYFLPFEEGRLGLAVGDVSGKSVPAALLMSNVLAVLRAEAQIGVAVDESLSRINRLIAEQVEPNRFVTLFYGVVDRPSETVRYASAGHNPPLILRADGTAVWLHHGGTPLGVVADTKYRAATERFTKGDVLVLYSDGVTEAEAESASEQLFGESRLVDAVAGAMAKARSATATEILEAVLESLHRFTGGQPASDDRTLVVVRAT